MINSKKRWIVVIASLCLVATGSYLLLIQDTLSSAETTNIGESSYGLGREHFASGKARGFEIPDKEKRRAESLRLWAEYKASKVGDAAAGSEIIGTIAAIGFLPSTRANVNEVFALLRSNITKEERIELLRLLGKNLYWDTEDPSIRTDIARFLASAALESRDRDIASAATLAYTRLGYFPDSLSVLEHAYQADSITEQDYYGEMAHMLPGAPSPDQLALIRHIENGKNEFSRDVLLSALANKDVARSLSPEVQAAAARLLAKWEPNFGEPLSTMGGSDAMSWQHWLGASVTLNAQLSGVSENSAMAKLLRVDDTADPRKLVVALWTEPSAEIVKTAFDAATRAKIDARLAAYGASNPDRLGIQEFVQTARRNLASAEQK